MNTTDYGWGEDEITVEIPNEVIAIAAEPGEALQPGQWWRKSAAAIKRACRMGDPRTTAELPAFVG